MDLDLYINRNRTILLRILGVLFASIGLVEGKRVAVLPRFMRSHVLHYLRPAESALRRLILAVATELERKGYVPPMRGQRAAPALGIKRGDGTRIPAFALIDPRPWFWWIGSKRRAGVKNAPSIGFFDSHERRAATEPKPEATPNDPIDAERLCNRMLSLKTALDDIPKQAKRMLRLKARDRKKFNRKSPVRPGWPPGWRQNGRDEIDEVLRDCHRLALDVIAQPDTS